MEMKISESLWYYLDDCLTDAVRFGCAPTLAEIHRQMKEPASLQVEEHQTEAISEFLEDIAETEENSLGAEAAKLAKNLNRKVDQWK